MRKEGGFSGGPVVTAPCGYFTAEGVGLIPGQGTKIPQALGHAQERKKGKKDKGKNCGE